jgi:hypothetical protein
MSYAQCAAQGITGECNFEGDIEYRTCFLELRQIAGAVSHISTGCKSRQACDVLKAQNFVNKDATPAMHPNDQCKPPRTLNQRNRLVQSVCRQCFYATKENLLPTHGIRLNGAGPGLALDQFDAATDWTIGDSNTDSSFNRDFWFEDLKATQLSNN